MNMKNGVSQQAWLDARLALLAKEKAHSRARDELTQARMAMPRLRIEKIYQFDSATGPLKLADLFRDKTQLLVHHFMFDADWNAGCKLCSFSADHYDRSAIHLANRDVAMVAVSIAPLSKLLAFRKRMGWSFDWVSSANSEFNRDFHVSFTDEELAAKKAYYNYHNTSFPSREAPGFSAFVKDEGGNVFHTYSCFGRGLETTIGAYNYLDLVEKGRDEEKLPFGMSWVRLKDEYADQGFADPSMART